MSIKKLFACLFLFVCAACTSETVPKPLPTARIIVTVAPTETRTPIPTDTLEGTPVPPTPTLIPAVPVETEPTETPIVPTDTPEPTAPPTETPEPTVPAETIIEIPNVTLPEGFSLIKYADIIAPTGLAFSDDGTLYATSLNGGEILAFRDQDGDGRSDFSSRFSFGFDQPVGIAQHPETGDLYVSSTAKISILRDLDGDYEADEAVNFTDGLPHDRHKNNNLKFGADGWLYMGVGSTCDVCYEVDERSATIMRFDTETGASEVYATGLRNAYDIAFNAAGDLFSTENGRDDLGTFEPFEELNHIVEGGDYGFPDCWNESDQPGCENSEKAVAFFEARSSTNSITFYDGSTFPAEYDDVLFAGVFGSWVNQNIGRGILQLSLDPSGDTYAGNMEWFAEWPNGWILGMAIGPDGALYVGDYQNGGIYRISYGL